MNEFSDSRVLVTGGTRGIGRAIVEAFARQGARVAFTFRSSADSAEALAATVSGRAFQADASDFAAAQDIAQAVVQDWGRIDILVNNAGIVRDNLLMRMSEGDWDQVQAANLKSVFNYCKAVCRPMMRQRQGRIVNISSVVGQTGNAGQANYAASKSGMVGLTKSLAKELGSRGITVNVVAPGYVETDMTRGITEKARAALTAVIPLRRSAMPEEIAAAVLFLASPSAAYITGQVLGVDGGLSM